ncbi:uncharacterized protein LOC129755777 [Uranotaenia lowii]|uniref:uncharacterized protein LOC129755777 n=1 Tax=Uranotaenia lowii TaxID=190385 RepID=UPI0024788176|nr:uncharacterized protein LOC129755777 [Uranotaenia lowii]
MEEASAFDKLPDELVEQIFDKLRLDARKTASQVCRRWSEIAFSKRFLRHVTLKISFDGHCGDLGPVLENSCRSYRNMTVTFCGDLDYVVPYAMLKFASSLESLVFLRDTTSDDMIHSEEYLRAFLNGLYSLYNLKELRLEIPFFYDFKAENIDRSAFRPLSNLENLYIGYATMEDSSYKWPEIAPNVKHLYFSNGFICKTFYETVSFYSKQLESFGTTSVFPDQYFTGFDASISFPNVRKLSIVHQELPSLKHFEGFMNRFTDLLALVLALSVSSEMFTLCVNKFPLLEYVALYENIPEETFSLLSKLPKLRHLKLSYIGIECASGIYRCGTLKNLRHLTLDVYCWKATFIDTFFETLAYKAPHLERLEVAVRYSDDMMPAICKNFPKLRKLAMDYTRDNLCHSFLQQLTQLEELRINSTDFKWNQMRCPSIRTLFLKLHKSQFNKYQQQWDEIGSCLPSLKTLELTFSLSEEQTARLQSTMPSGCHIITNSRNQLFESDLVDINRQAEDWLHNA